MRTFYSLRHTYISPGARLPGTRRLAALAKAATDGLVISEALLAEIRGT